ncbi:extracellular solute-binding protein [Siccirubricoccus sp. KC 17139]|uniref:Extracellular solute-binding protein n=1 Tax=Siccirubricoccus soli TaxID=2899147 RepID=A0ABT1D5A8_9PROT|nr:extracellular solute-binding protein [Siccirubricoccus soli]MCO6417112.1 extracellular solute-binding protein [Siccirubricoccus soli]MCP2683247.1 extracellular solute-binding protein [Siccirubricoccus soli]
MHIIHRRTALQLGIGAAALAAFRASAQAPIAAADTPAPRLPIESGATLRMLRPVRFVQPDEDVFRANAARFTQQTGVQVRVDFVGWEDITQQTAVTANTGAGPDLIIGFGDAPHIFAEKLIELTDVAEYLGKRYGGWMAVGEKYGKRHGTNNWIGLPFGGTAGPLVWRKSAVTQAGFQKPPQDLAGFLDLCKKLKAANKPPGFALGNAVGDGNGFANWLLWSHGASLTDEEGKVSINSPQTIAALNYLKELYPTFLPGTLSWGDISNNRAYAANECWLTSNGVSLYFSLKSDPATAPIAADTEHDTMPLGQAGSWPSAPLTMNAMVFKHSRFPNASKAFLQFMMEREQYDPWLIANLGYWAHPLAAYGASAVWTSDPKVAIFRDSMNNKFWNGYKGPISEASGQANAEYVTVQMCAAVASGQATPEQAAREAERRARRIFRR